MGPGALGKDTQRIVCILQHVNKYPFQQVKIKWETPTPTQAGSFFVVSELRFQAVWSQGSRLCRRPWPPPSGKGHTLFCRISQSHQGSQVYSGTKQWAALVSSGTQLRNSPGNPTGGHQNLPWMQPPR